MYSTGTIADTGQHIRGRCGFKKLTTLLVNIPFFFPVGGLAGSAGGSTISGIPAKEPLTTTKSLERMQTMIIKCIYKVE